MPLSSCQLLFAAQVFCCGYKCAFQQEYAEGAVALDRALDADGVVPALVPSLILRICA